MDKAQAESAIQSVREAIDAFDGHGSESAEAFRLQFLSKKGEIPKLFGLIPQVAAEQRKAMGQQLNELKQAATARHQELQQLSGGQQERMQAGIDLSLPSGHQPQGAIHPISQTLSRILEVFERIGFNVSEGPEAEDDWHNFTALNFPPDHPAREMQDTFFLEGEPQKVLRTHTSPVQIRVMEAGQLPIRTLSPGRVYRNETISARAHCLFHQVEGLYISKGVSFQDLKQTLIYFAQELFGEQTQIRLRPSYFPFTEPSAELDISCPFCEQGCNICKYTRWVEIGGCGMVDPAVLENCGIDPEVYSGFAFGMGVERIAMLIHQINDLRLFTENDVRFLGQFKQIV